MILYQDMSRLTKVLPAQISVLIVAWTSDDDLLPKCDILSIGTQTAKKSTREKGTQYKETTIRNKFTPTVTFITYNMISTKQCHILVFGIKEKGQN